MSEIKAFADPDHPGNSPEYHTGKPCIESGCDLPAGTAWSPHWCFKHNVERIRRIDGQLSRIAARFGNRKEQDAPSE